MSRTQRNGGTQGEWFTISAAERKQLMHAVGRKLGGKIPLIAGCSGYTTAEVAANARLAADHGFDGILVTPPPYMVPTDREILGFYREVNAAVSLPICVYNWPPGTNVDMSLELLLPLEEHGMNIVRQTLASLGKLNPQDRRVSHG